MGAFLILRHSNLDLLIWPKRSGFKHTSRIWMSIELKSKDLRLWLNDQILNSKAIRRYSWDELHDTPVETIFPPNDAETSEGPESNLLLKEDCKRINEFGYMTPATQRLLGNKGLTWKLPRTIHKAKGHKAQWDREEKKEEPRKSRDQMDVQRMVDLTV
jgi:hypothetical protein